MLGVSNFINSETRQWAGEIIDRVETAQTVALKTFEYNEVDLISEKHVTETHG